MQFSKTLANDKYQQLCLIKYNRKYHIKQNTQKFASNLLHVLILSLTFLTLTRAIVMEMGTKKKMKPLKCDQNSIPLYTEQ